MNSFLENLLIKLQNNMNDTNLKTSMFVIGVVFNNSFNIENFYELLPIVPISNFKFVKDTKLPFFGINDVIVSLSPKVTKGDFPKKHRGIRPSKFANSVTIDYQTHNKNLNIKVSSSVNCESKFHITGLTSYSMAEEATLSLIEHIKITDRIWTPFFMKKHEDKLSFLSLMCQLVMDPNDNTKLLSFNDPILHSRLESLKDSLGDMYECTKLIIRYTFEDSNITEFGQRLTRILNLKTGTHSIFHNQADFSILLFDIYNGVYNGKICNNDIYLIYLSEKLLNLGYNCCFTNIAKTEIRILLPIYNEIHHVKSKNTSKTKGHLFAVKVKGSIELYSKGNPEEALQIGNEVLSLIRSIINSDDYKDKSETKSIDSLELNYSMGMNISSQIPILSEEEHLEDYDLNFDSYADECDDYTVL